MKTQVRFIQGTGEEGHREDRKLMDNLRADLGQPYERHYQEMPEAEGYFYTQRANRPRA